MTRLLCVILSVALTAPPVAAPEIPAEITDTAAREHFSAGMTAWLAEDYPTAQRELEAAYAIQPVPLLLYSLGQLSRLQGDCEHARERFLAYLETDPPPRAAEDTRVNLERCQSSAPAPAPVVSPPAVVADEPEPVVAPAPVSRRPDPLGLGLTVGGTVLALTGAVLFGSAFARQDRAERESDVDAFERGVRGATAQYWSGVALLGAGGAVLVGGIVRLAIERRRARTRAGVRASSR